MWAAIGGILQIIYLILKNKLEKDEAIRKEKEAFYAEAKEAVKSGDVRRINAIINSLRQ